MILKMPENVSCNLVPEDYKFVEEDFRTLVRENNRFVASVCFINYSLN